MLCHAPMLGEPLPLSAGEVEDLKAAWRNQVNNQTRKRNPY